MSKQPIVFISYAHESDEFRTSVKALVDWLKGKGCTVLSDYDYPYRPPELGWQVWMLNCIRQAEIVLVVCTPKLKAQYERNAAPDTGRGATYEGAIVTQYIYDSEMRNTKFFPVLPDCGREEDIPTFLKSWWNGHHFPNGNDGILRMIVYDPSDAVSEGRRASKDSEGNPQCWAIDSRQMEVAILYLEKADPFLNALRSAIRTEFPGTSAPANIREVVAWFCQSRDSDAEDFVLKLFIAVRISLKTVRESERDESIHQNSEKAAVALWCLAACRLVNQTAHKGEYVVSAPFSERIICAIIATALFGGELRFAPSGDSWHPQPEYVFEIKVPAGGDQLEEDFERAVYLCLFSNDRDAPNLSLDAGPLKEIQRERLKARFRTKKLVQKVSFALVVQGISSASSVQGRAETYKAPVFLPDTEATKELLGTEPSTLLAEIEEFWQELKFVPQRGSHPESSPPTSP